MESPSDISVGKCQCLWVRRKVEADQGCSKELPMLTWAFISAHIATQGLEGTPHTTILASLVARAGMLRREPQIRDQDGDRLCCKDQDEGPAQIGA